MPHPPNPEIGVPRRGYPGRTDWPSGNSRSPQHRRPVRGMRHGGRERGREEGIWVEPDRHQKRVLLPPDFLKMGTGHIARTVHSLYNSGLRRILIPSLPSSLPPSLPAVRTTPQMSGIQVTGFISCTRIFSKSSVWAAPFIPRSCLSREKPWGSVKRATLRDGNGETTEGISPVALLTWQRRFRLHCCPSFL